ncbi:MAG TPA: SGNH/GDSL hydrolase family protein [Pirellulales bacterium]|nr:SGNH/GDSL hydrolase family protein [Pirellulales bacterium]
MAVLAGLGYRHFWLARPIGAGPAGPSVSREPFETVWSERPVLLLGFGDSITAGFGAPRGHGYFDRLAQNPADEFEELQGICLQRVLPKLQTCNLALSGSTSLEHAEMLVSKIEPQDDETLGIVVMTTGGNDVIHNYGRTPPREGAMYGATLAEAQPWIENFQRRLDGMLDEIETKFPGGCHFFLANIFDPTDAVGDAERAGLPAWPEGLQVLDAYNRVIKHCAEQRANVHLIDMRGAFLGHGIHCTQFWNQHYCAADPHYWYYENLEDPNDRGYDALRRAFLIEMARVLPEAFAAGAAGEKTRER